MGGDFGAAVVAKAAVGYLENNSDTSLILVGEQQEITAELNKLDVKPYERLKIHHASQRVEMNESPSQALRTKKDSSMRVAINLCKRRCRTCMCECRQHWRVNGNCPLCA